MKLMRPRMKWWRMCWKKYEKIKEEIQHEQMVCCMSFLSTDPSLTSTLSHHENTSIEGKIHIHKTYGQCLHQVKSRIRRQVKLGKAISARPACPSSHISCFIVLIGSFVSAKGYPQDHTSLKGANSQSLKVQLHQPKKNRNPTEPDQKRLEIWLQLQLVDNQLQSWSRFYTCNQSRPVATNLIIKLGTGLLQGTCSKPVPMQQVRWVFSFSNYTSPVLYLLVLTLR